MTQTYDYKVRDRSGSLVTGQLAGDSEALVLQRLREMGMTPVAVKKAGTGMRMEINLRPGRVKLKQIAVFCRQFATMVNSGLPILRALSILADQTQSEELSKVLVQVRTDVEHGASLSAAMGKHPKAFNTLFVSMVKAGETGGVLDDVLLSLASQIEKEVELRRQIKSAMTYPVVVVALVSLILGAMLLFVVPQFETIYSNLGGQLPLPTRVLLGVSDAFRSYWYIFGLGLGVFIVAFRRYERTDNGRARVDALKLRIPVFGLLFHKVALARFSSTLGMLLRAGVPILQALDNVKETVNNRVIADAVDDVKTSVREGESIARPLGKHKVFPPMVVQMLAVGEETGAVDTMLDK
ncbi:MAG TPA: type II secretion system F family protein, partial [Actinomycetota bacterium]|nr:type II secretion system F family protein [Actinomycetota bacterium]